MLSFCATDYTTGDGEAILKIKGAFEAVGVTWIPENGGAATVRPPRQLPDEARAQDKVDA